MESNNDTENVEVRLVITTFPDSEVARQIGTDLVQSQLIACINLIPKIESIYHWQGEIETESELFGVMKTTDNQLVELQSKFQSLHPYDVPEFLVIEVCDGLPSYLDWVKNYCQKPN